METFAKLRCFADNASIFIYTSASTWSFETRLETGAPSMTDVLIPDRMGRNERLERLDAVIDWDRVDGLLSDVHSSQDGRPGYPPLIMVKVMLLQQWHNPSDPDMERGMHR